MWAATVSLLPGRSLPVWLAQLRPPHRVTRQPLDCVSGRSPALPSEGGDGDEVYFIINDGPEPGRVLGDNLSSGDTVQVNRPISPGDTVELWEEDYGFGDDQLRQGDR